MSTFFLVALWKIFFCAANLVPLKLSLTILTYKIKASTPPKVVNKPQTEYNPNSYKHNISIQSQWRCFVSNLTPPSEPFPDGSVFP